MSIKDLKELERVFLLLHKCAKNLRIEQQLVQNGLSPCSKTHAIIHREAYDSLPEAYRWKTTIRGENES
jgi:hypothetical protein